MSKNNKTVKDKMLKKYGKKCFIEELGLRTKEEIEQDLKKYNSKTRKVMMALTFHHIKERRDGGEATEENGAILRNINHQWFNNLSKSEQRRINNLFIKYKSQDKFKSFKDKLRVSVTDDKDIIYKEYIELRRLRERRKLKWQGHEWGIDERE